MDDTDRLRISLALLDLERRPKELFRVLRDPHRRSELLGNARNWLSESGDKVTEGVVSELLEQRVTATFLGESTYPRSLASMPTAPPILFMWGSEQLFDQKGVGMCGSRNVSPTGLQAARACGDEVASHNLTIVSGYAKGVDTETHLAALRSNGRTVIVLAEGIMNFRQKKIFSGVPFDQDHVLVVSQFPPRQRWNVGAAMTRNAVIAGLGRALVVIEAGETGGTVDAGRQALAMGRPVIALEFESQKTPPGNRELIEKGALPVRTRQQLGRVLAALSEDELNQESLQLALL